MTWYSSSMMCFPCVQQYAHTDDSIFAVLVCLYAFAFSGVVLCLCALSVLRVELEVDSVAQGSCLNGFCTICCFCSCASCLCCSCLIRLVVSGVVDDVMMWCMWPSIVRVFVGSVCSVCFSRWFC